MALVDTQGFVMAVDRSLFGPQGRRWIERKLPDVVTNLAFITVSAVGALILCFHITREYYRSGYWAILQTPKHVLNAVILHLVARALRWHLDRLLGLNFAARDQAVPDFFAASTQEGVADGRDDGNHGNTSKNSNNKAAVLWPWQSSHSHSRSTQPEPRDRLDSTASTTDQDTSRSHRRSRSEDWVPTGAVGAGAAEGGGWSAAREAVVGFLDGESGGRNANKKRDGGKTVRRAPSSLCLPPAVQQQQQQQRGEKGEARRRRRSSSSSEHGLAGGGGGETEDGDDDDDNRSHEHQHHQHHAFPDLFGACRPGHNNHRRGRTPSSPPSTPVATRKEPARPSSLDRNRFDGGRRDRLSAGRRSLSPETPHTAAHRWIKEGGGGEPGTRAAVGAGGAARQGGWTSDDGGAGGQGAGVRGSRRRRRSLMSSSFSSQVLVGIGGDEAGDGGGDGGGGGGNGASRRWKPIDKLSRALGSTRRRASMQAGGLGRDRADRGGGNEVQQPQLNFFTEADLDELLHSTFFIKMCDDASWLYVEDHPYVPELNWLLTLWGGYKIAPRFQGEVKQNEAHRMLFQCESGRHHGNIRIRSRATNTFLFFLGVKQPLTWVAWDRDVVGGDWEDLELEWVGKPQGPDGVLVGDERGRVVIRSRRINGYVSWNGSRFTHVPGREGATVFMLQRMAPSSSSSGGGGGGSGGGGSSTSLSASSSSTTSRRTGQRRADR
eukprot:g5957.t1